MHFFDVDAVTSELRRERGVSEKKMRQYYLLYLLMLGIYIGIYFLFFYGGNQERPWVTPLELFWIGLSVLAWLGCYFAHGRGSFSLFAKRMICLGVPIGFSTLLYVLPAPIFTLLVMRYFLGADSFNGLLPFSLPFLTMTVFMYLYFTYYGMMCGQMRKVTE